MTTGNPIFGNLTATSPLTEDEKNGIMHFLGYASWSSLAQSIQLGIPMASQPLFLVYDSFVRISPGGIESVRRDLCECQAIEKQLSDARSRMKAVTIGNIGLNPRETFMLRDELRFWTKRLADDLGVVQNPYSQMSYLGMGGGISGKVSG